jgi:carbamoyl-phosphate synthase large subunit
MEYSSMSNSLTVLVTSAGRRHHLIETFRSDASELGLALTVVAVDSRPELSAACKSADFCAAVPRCTSPDYPHVLADLCAQYGATVLVPTIDTELLALAEARASFQSRGVSVVISTPFAIRVARDKLLTASTLLAAGVPTPMTIPLTEAIAREDCLEGPVILKPVDGSNSIGIIRLANLSGVRALDVDPGSYVAQQLCEGPEFTVNCYVSRQDEVLAAVPHRRLEVRGGEVSKARTERRADLIDQAARIVAAIPGLQGPFCFQAIVGHDGPRIIEVNARFGGGYPIAHAAGAHFGRWIMEEHLQRRPIAAPAWEDGVLMLRYDSAVFVRGRHS